MQRYKVLSIRKLIRFLELGQNISQENQESVKIYEIGLKKIIVFSFSFYKYITQGLFKISYKCFLFQFYLQNGGRK